MNKHIEADYKSWGFGGTIKPNISIDRKNLTTENIEIAIALTKKAIDVEDFSLKFSGFVNYYQGPDQEQMKLVLLRFIRNVDQENILGGEHVSILIDLPKKRIIGLTKMLSGHSSNSFITHQQALSKAIEFLKNTAGDLVNSSINLPELMEKPAGIRMDFVDRPTLDNIELHWIGSHTETISVNEESIIINGMKVKFYQPKENLWAWVVIDNNGDIITFERNVFWNFDEYRRETQMWLHDRWLMALIPM